jgi:hypothetical protein
VVNIMAEEVEAVLAEIDAQVLLARRGDLRALGELTAPHRPTAVPVTKPTQRDGHYRTTQWLSKRDVKDGSNNGRRIIFK